jgi:dTDP-4-amino-4,6-dideoxygalactose transaminase
MNDSEREFIPFHTPEIGDAEINSVVETLRSGWLTTGPKVKRFEADFAGYIGCSHAVAVNSGTAALHLALDAVGINEGDEVIVPTMTFTATAEVILYFKAKPVLIDCEPGTLNLDPNKIEQAVTSKTKAIIPVHMAGQPCAMNQILAVAEKYNLRVIEDAAHALPARYQDRAVGTIGDITCFSFYATKTITTGEGGMATTETGVGEADEDDEPSWY